MLRLPNKKCIEFFFFLRENPVKKGSLRAVVNLGRSQNDSKTLFTFWNDTDFFSCLLMATTNEGGKMLQLGIASVRRLVYYDANDSLLPLRASFCLVISSARPQQRLDSFQKKNDSPWQNLALSRTI